MTQKNKIPNRNLVLVLAALFALSLVGLSISVSYYYSEMNNKDTQIQLLNDQLDSIQAQIANQTAPNLITLGMNYNDDRTNQTAPFLHVTGYIVNVGTTKANNCTLHAYAIQNDNATAIDTSMQIEPINAGAYQKIDLQFPYIGTPIILYSCNIEWNS